MTNEEKDIRQVPEEWCDGGNEPAAWIAGRASMRKEVAEWLRGVLAQEEPVARWQLRALATELEAP